MTLLRQIMLVMIAIFLLLFGIHFILTVFESRTYLEEQMRSHSQDTATSLGLSMTTAVAEQDEAILEVLANAVFDRGYYQEINLTDSDGKILISRINPIKIDDVPTWFTKLVRLPSPQGSSEIMNGWYLFCFITTLSYIVIGIVLRILLHPLKQVEYLTNEICERKFSVLNEIPKTKKLKKSGASHEPYVQESSRYVSTSG